VALVIAVALAPTAARATATSAAERLRAAIEAAKAIEPAARIDTGRAALDVALLSAPLLAAVAIAAGAASMIQSGGVVTGRALAPRIDRLDPFAGLGRLASRARLFAAARAIVAGALVAWLAAYGLRRHAADLARLAGRLDRVAPAAAAIAASIAWWAAIAGLALAAIDAVVARAAWRRRLRMSREEVLREQREAEGDPAIEQARDRARHELMGAAAIASVRGASVVVVGAGRTACALRYVEGEDAAPVVVARGEGDLAEPIVRAARDYGVAIVDAPALARALVDMTAGDAIPEALYEAAADAIREALDAGG
jgi:flagellar biosynthetic protein FlhB